MGSQRHYSTRHHNHLAHAGRGHKTQNRTRPLATPLRIVGKHLYFISLKIPCSAVKRGEQVALLATDVNYHEKEMRVKLCLTGNKGFCSIVANNKLELYDANRV